MKFPYVVKHDGVYYPIGAEVPIETTPTVEAVGDIVSGKVGKYTEEDLSLPYLQLKSLALKEGFNVSKNAKKKDIQEMLRSL